ncbi:hypothetical protein, partial [Kaarinaea lacus]
MDQFRLILIFIGIALLLLVYFVSRRSNSRQQKQSEAQTTVTTSEPAKVQTKQRIPMSGDVAPPERPYQVAI